MKLFSFESSLSQTLPITQGKVYFFFKKFIYLIYILATASPHSPTQYISKFSIPPLHCILPSYDLHSFKVTKSSVIEEKTNKGYVFKHKENNLKLD